MALSGMSSREKTIVGILVAVIVIALIAIGILGYRLLFGTGGQPQTGISVTEVVTTEGGVAEPTATLVAPPSLEGLSPQAGAPVSTKPVVVAQVQGVGPLAPVIIAGQPLVPGHRYRLEVTAKNGSKSPIQGSWAQAATSLSGQIASPQMNLFDGTTPYRVDIAAPVSDPGLWSISASAGHRGLLAEPPVLVMTIWDVTGGE